MRHIAWGIATVMLLLSLLFMTGLAIYGLQYVERGDVVTGLLLGALLALSMAAAYTIVGTMRWADGG